MHVGLSLGIAGPNLPIEQAMANTITVGQDPSLAGIGPITEGETHAAILARMTNPGSATTDGPGGVMITPTVTGASDPVVADETVTIRINYTATQATPVVRILGPVVVAPGLGGMVTAANQGGVTFPFSGAPRVVGNSLDGAAYIVVPEGQTLTLQEPTPAFSGGRHGAMINPLQQRPGDGTGADLAFDSRIGNYNGANAATFPATVQAGDIIVKAISRTDTITTEGERRNGVPQEWAVCHIVAAAPAANEISPAPFGWPGRGAPVWQAVDLATVQALRPLLPTGSQRVMGNIDTIIDTRLDRFNPGLVATTSNSGGGYEEHCVYQYGSFSQTNGKNYGANILEIYSAALIHWMSDATSTEIDRLVRHWVTLGVWLLQIHGGRPQAIKADGGHSQWQFFAEIFALLATGRSNDMAAMLDGQSNQLYQPFQWTQALLDRAAAHDNNMEPYTWRRRDVSAVTPTTITFDANAGALEPVWHNYFQMELRRDDGTLIGTVTDSGTYAASEAMTLDVATTAGLTTSDQI